MTILDTTISMLEVMPEEAQKKVCKYTQQLFSAPKPASPFVPVSEEQVLADLKKSRDEISKGKGMEMGAALNEMGKRHGFI